MKSERLLLHEVIGEGAFGVVRRGSLAPNGKEVAVKMLKGKQFLVMRTWSRMFGSCKPNRKIRHWFYLNLLEVSDLVKVW